MKLSTTSNQRRISPFAVAIIAGGFILIGTISYLFVQKNNSKTEQIELLTEMITQEDLAIRIRTSGKVEPIKSVNVSPKNPGRLVKLLVEQGDFVERGQTLAVMENEELAAQKARAEAQLAEAIALLEQNRVGIAKDTDGAEAQLNQLQAQLSVLKARLPKEIAQAEARVNSANSRVNLAQQRIERNQYLLDSGAISKDTFDEAENEKLNAQANLRESEEALTQLKNTEKLEIEQLKAAVREANIALQKRQNTSDSEILALEARVNAARANLQQLEVQYSDTIVAAPFSGIVTQRYAVEGSFVTPSTSASTSASASATSILALAQGLEIIAKVPEVDIGQLRSGQKVEIIADAYPEILFEGKVKRIAPEAIIEDNVTSFEVRIALVTGQDKLRSKMNVDATFIGEQLENTLVVPTVAITIQKGQTGVMKLNNRQEPEFSPVTIGLTIEDKTQIIEGLTPQDRVFIDLPEDYQRQNDE